MASVIPSHAGPSWEDQVVPTLRKRLESESVYLSTRLSSSQYLDTPSGSGSADGSSSSQLHPRTTSSNIPTASRGGTSLSQHQFLEAGPSKQGPRKSLPNTKLRTPSTTNKATPHSLPSPSQPLPPSRIPIRPRSKSQLGPRPKFAQSISDPTNPHPPLPEPNSHYPPQQQQQQHSNIPVSTQRRKSSPKLPAPDHTMRRSGSSGSAGFKVNPLGIGTGPRLDSRNSLDFVDFPGTAGQKIVEGFIKNELPPFKIFPGTTGAAEALRIAEQGHDIDDNGVVHEPGEEYDVSGQNPIVLSGEVRRRSITMRPEGSKVSKISNRNSNIRLDEIPGLPSSGISISHVPHSVGLGLGLPSTRKLKINGNDRGISAPSRTAKAGEGGGGSAFSQVSRTTSLNMLASPSLSKSTSSRLGVAAHFVPPETTYTPPKGANWDEVVLPTVAKKLALGEEKHEDGEEGDLAVEWDRDGVPIKWVKRKDLKLDASQDSGRPALTPDHSHSNANYDANAHTPTSSTFSPSFEPSPNNPLCPPSVRQKRSGENIELGPVPLRTSSGQPTALTPSATPTPATLGAPIQGWSSQTRADGMERRQSERTMSHQSHGNGPAAPTAWNRGITPKTSQMSLRSLNAAQLRANPQGQYNASTPFGQQSQGGGANYFENPRESPRPQQGQIGTTHLIQEHAYGDKYARYGAQNGNGDGSGHRGQKGKHGRKKDEEVGKGCGCLIM